MRLLISILLLLFVTSSCSTTTEQTLPANNKFDTLPLPLDSSTFYFRTKVNWQDTTQNALDTFVNTWYSEMLYGLREPILSNYQGDKEIYRFTWLRTFHHPVSVRLEKQNDVIILFSKVSNGAGGYEPGQLIFDTAFNATKDEYKTLIRKIDEIKFWSLKTEHRDDTGIGSDGSEWIIEAVKNNTYHIVTRWTPSHERQGNFRSVGEYLVSISNINKDETKFTY